ncbi:unnamed protein product [Cyclocybe aegerita]|uniref:Uncharacterized protein n=1 Tax=Cyclocybe aegerita TaxID=1973307 RepID=A0A8S0VU50_CYCAE|nr:unnamed protein product [Cyclocybe aegerita]
MSYKIGIAFYAQKDYRGRPSSPHWTLVVHRSSYNAPDVLAFQVRQNGPQWFLAHKVEGVSLTAAPTCIGVLHVADVPLASGTSPATIAEFAQTFSSMKEGDDPSGNIGPVLFANWEDDAALALQNEPGLLGFAVPN